MGNSREYHGAIQGNHVQSGLSFSDFLEKNHSGAGIRYLLGELNVTEEELWQGVRDEEYIRQNLKERGNPYGYSEFLKEMIRILGIQIDYQWIKTEFEYENGPFLPQMLWLDRPGQVELARTAILELKRRFPFYQFN